MGFIRVSPEEEDAIQSPNSPNSPPLPKGRYTAIQVNTEGRRKLKILASILGKTMIDTFEEAIDLLTEKYGIRELEGEGTSAGSSTEGTRASNNKLSKEDSESSSGGGTQHLPEMVRTKL